MMEGGWMRPGQDTHKIIEAMIEDLITTHAANCFERLAEHAEWDGKDDLKVMSILTDTFALVMESLCDLVDKTGVAIIPERWLEQGLPGVEICEDCKSMLDGSGPDQHIDFEKWFQMEAKDPEEG